MHDPKDMQSTVTLVQACHRLEHSVPRLEGTHASDSIYIVIPCMHRRKLYHALDLSGLPQLCMFSSTGW
jgi:hypothetical protein